MKIRHSNILSSSGPTRVAEPLVDHSRVPKPERKGVLQTASSITPVSPPSLALDSDHNYFKPMPIRGQSTYGSYSSTAETLPTYNSYHLDSHIATEETKASSLKIEAPKRSNKVPQQELSLDDILAQKLQQTTITPKKKEKATNNKVTITTDELEELLRLREMYEKGVLNQEKKDGTPKKKTKATDKTGPFSTYSKLYEPSSGTSPTTIQWHKSLRS